MDHRCIYRRFKLFRCIYLSAGTRGSSCRFGQAQYGGSAEHTGEKWWMFALSGMLALLLALATVSFHAVRAAMSNPVKALRAD